MRDIVIKVEFLLGEIPSNAASVFLLSSYFKLTVAWFLYPFQLRQYEPFTRHSETGKFQSCSSCFIVHLFHFIFECNKSGCYAEESFLSKSRKYCFFSSFAGQLGVCRPPFSRVGVSWTTVHIIFCAFV